MGAKDQRKAQKKAEKKKRKKKSEQAALARQPAPLAYTGKKYKTEALVEPMLQVEIGIRQADVVTDCQLTDRIVISALERLILHGRRKGIPRQEEMQEQGLTTDTVEDLILGMILGNWQQFFETKSRPSRDQLVGVLRTIRGSIDARTSVSPKSRGYLEFIVGFLRKTGCTVEQVPADYRLPITD